MPSISPDALNELTLPDRVPLLPVRDLVVFPYMVVPLFVRRTLSVEAVNDAMAGDGLLFLAAQREAGIEEPSSDQIYDVGSFAKILRQRRMPDGQLKVLIQGLIRARVVRVLKQKPCLMVKLERLPEVDVEGPGDPVLDALVEKIKHTVDRLGSSGKGMPTDVQKAIQGLDDPSALADLVASNLGLKVPDAQAVLEASSLRDRLHRVREALHRELEAVAWREKIQSQAKEEMSRAQRDYFLREQMKQIQSELGDVDEDLSGVDALSLRFEALDPPESTMLEVRKQLGRLRRMSPESGEAQVLRSYLETVAELPWNTRVDPKVDIQASKAILDAAHYGLEPVKERILEYLAVLKLKGDNRGPILCFVGPPGVGKTSLGRGIATALGRSFVRIALGGVRDEAEIRGHRRTYVGAMPGRIVQGLKQAGQLNPVIMLDEIDKMGQGSRGDPAAALLEVLDFEQNNSFRDDYLGVPIDLSEVIWLATANLVEPIPAPLYDRMEVIHLPGYERHEKLEIAKRFIIPRQREMAGLKPDQFRLTHPAIEGVISGYTREAGLRGLERQIAALARKTARQVAEAQSAMPKIGLSDLKRYLGLPNHDPDRPEEEDKVGLALGLAWTEAGGTVLHIEAARMPGRSMLTLTGQLGNVMRESAQTALSCARSHAEAFHIPPDCLQDHELHLHVPQGAIPKDGPSAGITMAVALISLLSGRPVRRDVAMTGEITLRGRVLPIGGLRQKLLAAVRAGVREVIIPESNRQELSEISAKLLAKIQVSPVKDIEEVARRAIVWRPSDLPN